MILPAVGETPDGVATWRVTADGDPVTVRSRAQWVGSAEAAPQTVHPLTRPVRTVHVSLVGWDHVSELDVVQPSDPILFFSEDGRRLPPQLPLPPDHLWILRPADRELTTVGELHTITESPVPFGWEGWHLQLASLEKVRSLSLQGCPTHVVQGYTRPRLLLGEPLQGVTTPYGSPVYAIRHSYGSLIHPAQRSAGMLIYGRRREAFLLFPGKLTKPVRPTSGTVCRGPSWERSTSRCAVPWAAGCAERSSLLKVFRSAIDLLSVLSRCAAWRQATLNFKPR